VEPVLATSWGSGLFYSGSGPYNPPLPHFAHTGVCEGLASSHLPVPLFACNERC
jgi:hypothetical protein